MKLDRLIAVRNDKSVYRDGDVCIKVFGDGYDKAGVFSEALNQARIEEIHPNVPHIREVTKIDGKWAIVSDYIKGETFAQLIEKNPEKKDDYIDLLVMIQLDINCKSCAGLINLKDKLNRHIAESELDATVRYDLHSRLLEMPKGYGICHGDMTPSNIVITEDCKLYVIDWSHATQGHSCADAAMTYINFLLHGDEYGAEKYLEVYCKKSGNVVRQVRNWIPIVAASLSVNSNLKAKKLLLSLVEAEL